MSEPIRFHAELKTMTIAGRMPKVKLALIIDETKAEYDYQELAALAHDGANVVVTVQREQAELLASPPRRHADGRV